MGYHNKYNIKCLRSFSYSDYFFLLLIYTAITATGPFVLREFSWHPGKSLTLSILVVFLFIFLIKKNVRLPNFIVFISGIILVQILYFITKNMYHFYMGYINTIPMLAGVIITTIFIISYIGFEKFIYSNIIVFSWLSLICSLGFFLALLGKIEPHLFFDRGNGEMVYHFYLTVANTLFPIGEGHLIKMAGAFTEGGTMGFYIIHILLLNKISFDNKKYERILLISGLLTFSIAFYVSVFIYIILFYLNRSSLKTFLFFSGLVIVSFYLFDYYKDTNSAVSYIYSFIFERLGPYGTGVMSGGNRSELIIGSLPYIAEHPLFGYGYKYLMTTLNQNFLASITGTIIMHGIIGFVFVFLHFLFLSLKAIQIAVYKNNYFFLKASLIMSLNYIQRPFIGSYYPYLIIISMLYLCKLQTGRISLKTKKISVY